MHKGIFFLLIFVNIVLILFDLNMKGFKHYREQYRAIYSSSTVSYHIFKHQFMKLILSSLQDLTQLS